jgi:hypothetical protein
LDVGWLVGGGLLVGWLGWAGWLAGWLVGWLAGWLVAGWLAGWLAVAGAWLARRPRVMSELASGFWLLASCFWLPSGFWLLLACLPAA